VASHPAPDGDPTAAEQDRPPDARREAHLLYSIAAFAVVAGAALRLAAARGDLWLDEIWSLLLTHDADGPLGVFTRLHHDNNHHLNTLWMMLLGPSHSPLAYRALSVAAATGALAWLAARPLRRGPVDSAATGILLAFSYVLVHYGSEARGYSLAIFFAVAAYQALDLYLARGEARWAVLFAAAGVLGVSSHLTFAFPLAGLLAWAAADLYSGGGSVRTRLARAAPLAVPPVALAILWAVDLHRLVIGGGPEYDVTAVLRELARATHGVPPGPAELLLLMTLGAVVWEMAALVRARDPRALFFAVAFLAPAGVLAWRRPDFLAPRYFVVLVPFALLLAGSALARLARAGRGGGLAAAAALAAFVATNAPALLRLVEVGRGQYAAAIEVMLAASSGAAVSVGSDHDWRNLVVLQYHAQRVAGGERIVYFPKRRWWPEGPEWYVEHDFSDRPPVKPVVTGPNGRTYERVAAFRYAGLSGWSWTLYRLASPPGR